MATMNFKLTDWEVSTNYSKVVLLCYNHIKQGKNNWIPIRNSELVVVKLFFSSIGRSFDLLAMSRFLGSLSSCYCENFFDKKLKKCILEFKDKYIPKWIRPSYDPWTLRRALWKGTFVGNYFPSNKKIKDMYYKDSNVHGEFMS